LGIEEVSAVNAVVRSGQLTQGEKVAAFETAFASYIGTRYAVAVSSGTAALHLALVAAGIGAGDEVIVPNLTFIATANAVTYTGATVILADVDDSLCLDANGLEGLITPRTKAIIPVHLYGNLADMPALNQLAQTHHLRVLEDAAEALGADLGGVRVGGWGQAGCFSFYGNKTITTGEGGMITTDDSSLAARLRLLRGQGKTPGRDYWHEIRGYNYRLTEIQAALGLAQLSKLHDVLEARARVFRLYEHVLSDFEFPKRTPGRHGCWAFVMLLPAAVDRDGVRRYLLEKGIETRPVFPLLSEMIYPSTRPYPVAKAAARRGIVLPTYPDLKDREVIEIAETLKEAIHASSHAIVMAE
jgi:perosamine synthetase